MKTAQRILSTALALFNEHGEAAVSSVDIANECDISPGNLYYHFKGKEQLVNGLMKLHRAQMDEVLDKTKMLSLHVDEMFYYFFLVIQRMHLFRFLYRSPADLAEKYPFHRKQQKHFFTQLEQALNALFSNCVTQNTLTVNDTSVQNITALSSLIITQSCQYDQLMLNARSVNTHSDYEQYHALSLLMTALLPRCRLSKGALQALLNEMEQHNLPTCKDQGGSVGE
jgi:AcrR family transcriptional regulator